jgi:hypothetical protein
MPGSSLIVTLTILSAPEAAWKAARCLEEGSFLRRWRAGLRRLWAKAHGPQRRRRIERAAGMSGIG